MKVRIYYRKDGQPVVKDGAHESFVRIVWPNPAPRTVIAGYRSEQVGVTPAVIGFEPDGKTVTVIEAEKAIMAEIPITRQETETECEARCFARALEANPSMAGLDYIEIDASELPKDRANRNGWKVVDGKLEANPA